jgi:RNA polymerase sigma factor CnrH
MPNRSPTFLALYARHVKEVQGLIRLLGVPPSEVEDVCQDVFLAAYRNLENRRHDNEIAWLYTIAHNMVRTWRRTRKRRSEWNHVVDPSALKIPDLHTPEATADQRRRFEEGVRFLHRAVKNEARIDTLVLVEVGGMTLKEVAAVTGVPLSTAIERLKKARQELEEAVARMSNDERDGTRGLVLPFTSLDEVLDALRVPADELVSDAEVARGWERLSERISPEPIAPDAPSADPRDPLENGELLFPRAADPARFALAGTKLGGVLAGTFLAGAVSGIALLYAALARPELRAPTFATFEAPLPAPSPEHFSLPEPPPAPSAVAPTAARAAATAPQSAPSREEADALLNQARAALEQADPAGALRLVDQHARRFPNRTPARREEVAIRALLDLRRLDEAAARAGRLVQQSPSSRRPMETLLGRSFP